MQLAFIDWFIIAAFFVFSLVVGLRVSRKAGSNTTEFFLSGRNMPWWLLGVSMVATTFSSDTPNLVTNWYVRAVSPATGAGGPFLLTGRLTVFVYARLCGAQKS